MLTSSLVKIVIAGLSVRENLKCLTSDENIKDIKQEERSSGILMFWCVYSFLTIWERHVEWALPLMTWIPGYFYVKLLLLIIAGIPSLKVAKFLFKGLLIPILEKLHYRPKLSNKKANASEILISALAFILWGFMICVFPPLAFSSTNKKGTSSNDNIDNNDDENIELNIDIDQQNQIQLLLSNVDSKSHNDSMALIATSTTSKEDNDELGLDDYMDDDLMSGTSEKDDVQTMMEISSRRLTEVLFNSPKKERRTIGTSLRETIFNFDIHRPTASSIARKEDRRRTMDIGINKRNPRNSMGFRQNLNIRSIGKNNEEGESKVGGSPILRKSPRLKR